MITAADLWAAIERLAAEHNLTLADLAKRAGLPETALLSESRFSKDGQIVWPSLPDLLRIVSAVGANLRDFGALVDEGEAKSLRRPGGASR